LVDVRVDDVDVDVLPGVAVLVVVIHQIDVVRVDATQVLSRDDKTNIRLEPVESESIVGNAKGLRRRR
jgi:hypothetical protein